MANETFNVNANLELLQELLSCGTNVCLWHYGLDGHLVSANSNKLVLDRIFEMSGCKEQMIQHGKEGRTPFVLGGDLGLIWCAVYEPVTSKQQSIYVIGPVFNTEISIKTIEKSVREYGVDLSWRREYVELISGLPVVSSILFFQYTLMLHYCVTGEKLTRSDIQLCTSNREHSAGKAQEESAGSRGDRMQTYLAERALLNMVREGDLNYRGAMDHAALLSNGVQSGGENPLLHAVVSCTTFTSLCAREAIQAGISPDTAYSVGDGYIQSMVQAKDLAELTAISYTMYEDFILRVHKHRTGPDLSPYIQVCRDYIELHAEEELSLPILAKRVGYSEYHLSRKFKQEMGVSISSYIKYARVKRAKFLLTSTNHSVAQIAADLHFCSSSHFSNAFLEVTGKKPQQYRSENFWVK